MVLLENDGFLTQLTKLYGANRAKGSVWVTMKQSLCLDRPRRNCPEIFESERRERTCCLVRATDGRRKISTRVFSAKAEKFSKEFTLVQKGAMDGLIPEEKKKKKMMKEKEKEGEGALEEREEVDDDAKKAKKKKKHK